MLSDAGLSANQIFKERSEDVFSKLNDFFERDKLKSYLNRCIIQPAVEALRQYRYNASSDILRSIMEIVREKRGDITLTECAEQLNYANTQNFIRFFSKYENTTPGRYRKEHKKADSGIDDRYVPHQITCVTAYRLTGELLWQRGDSSCRPGSFGSDFPAQIYDIDGDGYDEVMAGYDLLDHNGQVLWSCRDLEDHADCLWVGDVNGDGKPEIAVGGSVTCLYSAEGEELWRYDGSVESQHIALGKFLPGRPGLQVAGLDRIRRGDGYKGQWDGKDGMFMLDCEGKELWKEDRQTKGWLTIVDGLYNWNGEGKDYILAYRRGGGVKPALYDGWGNTAVSFPEDGYVLHGDLFGRDKEDVIIYSEDTAWVFSGTPADLAEKPSGKPVPQVKRLYRSTLYPGGER